MVYVGMKKILLIAALTLTTGCNKIMKPMLSLNGTSSAPITIMVGGQSNAYNMVYYSQAILASQISKAHYSVIVKVINCSFSGSSVTDWAIGGTLYKGCLAAVKGQHIDAIMWNQGENEAEGIDSWNTWGQQTNTIIRGFRRDVANVPVIYARLSDFSNTWPYWSDMRTEQTEAGIPNSVMVNLDGVPGQHPGNLHFDQEGYDEIARRFAQAFNGMED